MTLDTVLLVPRWGGDARDDWYPWLASRVPGLHMAVVGLQPAPDRPEVVATVHGVGVAVGDIDPEHTLLVGHSVGCQALLRYLATTPPGTPFAGLACIAGWWTVDEPWPEIEQWLDHYWTDHPARLERVREAVTTISVLLSDDDPFTADWRTTADLWRRRLGAAVSVIAAGHHFNDVTELAVLDALVRHHGVPADTSGHRRPV